jgi:tRNA pseudouridine55 synthase
MSTRLDGLLVVDKPGGLTSREAVDRVQRWFPRRTRIGHTGTLDPLATGVLVLCLGQATRLTEYVQDMGKTYRSTFRLGARSDSDDADGAVTPVAGVREPTAEEVRMALAAFIGVIAQVPPAYSAAKVTGRRAYDLARSGEEVTLSARNVTVYGADVLSYAWPLLEVEVRCGKGTYIRSLARDLGERLGCGGLVQTLRRTRVGPFTVEEALSLDADPERARAALRPLTTALAELPKVTVNADQARRLRSGQALPWPDGEDGPVAALGTAGDLIAVVRRQGGRLHPEKVLPGNGTVG